ncbi:hypothetical protein KY328_05615 [Candidatus Woesearchaeota archaeon]|nr:hypothetical protein [Candidatus Woesearchaeota archaeon]MBW3022376.1 hypothetical protein [Candidatus Woesearchaeota archaeon]
MVAVKLMGLMDIIAVIVMVLLHFSIGSWRITLAFALYLIFKGFAFRGNIHSMIDTAIGIYMIFLLFGLHSILTFVPVIYLLQKALFSIMS